MCYEGSKFIGLKPLLASTKELKKRYEITIVFDAAIRSQTKSSTKDIADKFDGVHVHIVASKRLADDTILDVTSNDKYSYIISNDRFGEYKEKEVVKNDRIIRHEILNQQVLIHDLNINTKYS